MQISFQLGLRAQEISLLQVKEVAKLNAAGTAFTLHEVMSLPAARNGPRMLDSRISVFRGYAALRWLAKS